MRSVTLVRRAQAIALALGLWTGVEAARACSNVFGIPEDSRIRLLVVEPGGASAPVVVGQAEEKDVWTWAACEPSPDGRANALFRREGVELHVEGRRHLLRGLGAEAPPSRWLWHPDGRRAATMIRRDEQAAPAPCVVDIADAIGGAPPAWTYEPSPGVLVVYGMEWAGDGSALYLLSTSGSSTRGSRIERVGKVALGLTAIGLEPRDARTTEVARVEGVIDFIVTPFHHGRSAGPGRDVVLFSADRRLLLIDGAGARVRDLGLPGYGIYGVEWSPADVNELVVHYRRPVTDGSGVSFRGLWRLHIGAAEVARTQLSDDTRMHTMWYSARGRRFVWTSADSVFVADEEGTRELDLGDLRPDAGDLLARGVVGREGVVRGARWHEDERRLAVVVDDRLAVFDVEAGTRGPIHRLELTRGFAGHPSWLPGDRLLVTAYDVPPEAAPARPPLVEPPLDRPR